MAALPLELFPDDVEPRVPEEEVRPVVEVLADAQVVEVAAVLEMDVEVVEAVEVVPSEVLPELVLEEIDDAELLVESEPDSPLVEPEPVLAPVEPVLLAPELPEDAALRLLPVADAPEEAARPELGSAAHLEVSRSHALGGSLEPPHATAPRTHAI